MENTFEGWNNIVKNTQMNTREPMWDQAIKYLVSECAMEPTMYDTLTQGQIQAVVLGVDTVCESIAEVFSDFSKWYIGVKIDSFPDWVVSGKELWLLYLMLRYYAMIWDGENWVCIAGEAKK